MTIQNILMWAALGGLAVAMLTVYFAWCWEHGFAPLSEQLARFRKLPWYGQVFLLCFVGGGVLYGGSKTNTPPSGVEGGTNAPPAELDGVWTNQPPPLMTMARPRIVMPSSPTTGFTAAQVGARAVIVGVGTNETHDFAMPDGAHVVEKWRIRGAANERVKLGCTGGMPVPQGGGTASVQQQGCVEGEGIAVDTFGRVWTPGRVFAPLGIQLGMVPMANWARIGAASLCWWTVTASNSTVVCWQNALLNRDTNTPVSVLAEFQDNGKFEYRYDLTSLGAEATNVFARVETTNGVEGVALGTGVTSVRGHLLGPDDGTVLDKDGDGVTTYDEIFVYGTDPELPDTDGDGRTDGEEIFGNGSDPLVGDVSEAEIIARIAAGVTNEPNVIVEGELKSTKLWDGFVFYADPGTNVLYTRTFGIDRQGGWTSYFLSGRGEAWCDGGEDAIGEWSLFGCVVEWEDDTGATGAVTASPRNDTLYLPLGTNATQVTITLRAVARNLDLAAEEQDGEGTASVQQQGGAGETASVGAARRASPGAVYLLEYSPKIEFPEGQEFAGNDGNTYCVFADSDNLSFEVNESSRPCRAPAGAGEATAADFRMPSGPGVYRVPLSDMVGPDEHPLLLGAPGRGGPGDSGRGDAGGRYLVVLDPWVRYGTAHYGCWHEYPYDWGWNGYWCDCEPEVGSGVEGGAAVNAYISYQDDEMCVGIVEIAGRTVWIGEAYHVKWVCDHEDEEERYCPCGCDENCQYCSCMKSDGPSQGSIRFRVGLGTDADDQKIGFAWFESDGPVAITPQLFEVDSRPDADVREQNVGGTRSVTAYGTGGRDLEIAAISNGVSIAVKRHGEAQLFETWEVTNVGGSNSVVRLVKRRTGETPVPQGEGDCVEDWTYTCRWEDGEWVWEVADNISHEYVPSDPTEFQEDGTNWVFGVDGRLERLSVMGTNGEEVVIRTLSYDDDGRLVLVDDGTNGCVSITYDGAGNISEMTGPEGTLRAAWDENRTMTNLDTSAWNGPVPNAAPPLMAPGPGLLGAPNGGEYEGMSFWDVLMNYLHGNGASMWMPFSEIDTSWLTPKDFECVRSFISNCHEPGGYPISGTRVIPNDGPKQFFLGDITIRLDGTITYTGHCNWTFDGTMRALSDTFNFNKARRGIVGEGLSALGRLLFSANGTPFQIDFTGSKQLTGSGHCHDN